MSATFTRSLTAMMALGATLMVSAPASAMPAASVVGTELPIHQSNWSDRVRGRTSSSTPGLGYGWLYGNADVDPRDPRGLRHRPPYGDDRSEPAPYGYDEGAY